jgi:transketolase
MRKQFNVTVTDIAANDPKAVVVLGDISVFMFNEFQKRWPTRFYNMGICENTLISVAAGLASQGYHPFVHSIAPFLTERSVEQVKLDMSYNRFGGNIATCGSSFDYAWDGATHHCYTELSIFRLLPDAEVIQPGSKKEVEALLRATYANGKTTYMRLSDHPHEYETNVELGKGTVMKEGRSGVTVMTAGPLLKNVIEACHDQDVNVVYFHTLKPIDRHLVERFRDTKILVVQDAFGLREAINEVGGLRTWYHGLPDQFCVWYGTVHDIRRKIGLDPGGIRHAVRALMHGGEVA